MLTRILVPVDGSADADDALPYAIFLAGQSALIELLHVHRPHLPGSHLEPMPQYQFERIAAFDSECDKESFRTECRRLQARAADIAHAHGLNVSSRVLRGEVAPALAAHAQATGADLIVMSTHGMSGRWRPWLGSVADAVIRRSAIPVLLIRPQRVPPGSVGEIDCRRILVPVDGSSFSESIVPLVVEFAAQLGAEVTLMRVEANPRAEAAVERDRAIDYLMGLADTFPVNVPLPSTHVVAHHAPAQAILEEASAGGYDLLAMATHGRGGVHHLLLGSTADEVLRRIDLPIVLLRPQAAPATRERFASSPASQIE